MCGLAKYSDSKKGSIFYIDLDNIQIKKGTFDFKYVLWYVSLFVNKQKIKKSFFKESLK
jgi:hypothetical protein